MTTTEDRRPMTAEEALAAYRHFQEAFRPVAEAMAETMAEIGRGVGRFLEEHRETIELLARAHRRQVIHDRRVAQQLRQRDRRRARTARRQRHTADVEAMRDNSEGAA